jgi:hypothetical protein
LLLPPLLLLLPLLRCLRRVRNHATAQCIQGWTDRQRQHAADEACPAGHRCAFTCPLCKQPYAYIVYDIVGTSYR